MNPRKTDLILQHLSGLDEPASLGDIAAAIGEDDKGGSARTGALLSYLQGKGFVLREGERGSGGWRITSGGRAWIEELTGELDTAPAAEADAPKPARKAKPVREAVRQKVARRKRAQAADPEGLAPLPRRKVQRHAAEVQPLTGVVELTPPAPINGRAIAVREDGAVLVLERDQVVTTLLPEDARRIASVVNRLIGAPA
jgi:hypothetical protein